MKKRRRWPIVVGFVVVLALCAGGAFLVLRARVLSAAGEALADLEFGQVTRTTLSSVVESSGNAAPQQTVGLSFGTAGTLAQVNVEPGDAVKQGDVLATLVTSDLELQVAQAEQTFVIQQANYSMTLQADPAAVASAQAAVSSAQAAYQAAKDKFALSPDQVTVGCANLENAKDALDRAQAAYDNVLNFWKTHDYAPYSPQKTQLDTAQNNYDVALANCNLTKNGINDSGVRSALAQLEQAKSTLAGLTPRPEKVLVAEANMEQARLSLEQARLRLANASLVAPFDGLVTHVNVKAGGPSGAGAAVEVVDTGRYHIDVLIDEIEVAGVRAGQPVEVRLDALPDVTLSGTVARIDPAGTISQGIVTYNVRIDLDATETAPRIDMTANVRIIGQTHADVLAVPTAAVRSDVEGTYVTSFNQNGTRRIAVTVGLSDGDLTEVSGDLKEGMQVLLGEPPRLVFGQFGGGGQAGARPGTGQGGGQQP